MDAGGVLYASADGDINIESPDALLAENVFSEGTTNLRLTSGDLSVGVIHTVGDMNINVDSGNLTDASDDDTSTRDADIRSTGDINITVWGGLGTSTSRVDVFTEYDDQDTEDTSDDVYGALLNVGMMFISRHRWRRYVKIWYRPRA